MITLADINIAYRKASKPERNEFLNLILPDLLESKIFNSNEFRAATEMVLLTSGLRPIKRISKLESVTGLDDYDPEEKHEPTLPERIRDLETQFENSEYRPTVRPQIECEPTTKTELRASLLVEALEASGKDHFTANEIIDFLKCKLPDTCKIDEKVQNIRKVKQDVVRKATEMFANVLTNKKTTGHKDVRLVLVS